MANYEVAVSASDAQIPTQMSYKINLITIKLNCGSLSTCAHVRDSGAMHNFLHKADTMHEQFFFLSSLISIFKFIGRTADFGNQL